MPVSLVEALEKKYREDDTASEDYNSNCDFVIFAPRTGLHQAVPKILIVSSSEINVAGNPCKLKEFLEEANELDVSSNALSNLIEIGAILQASPKLLLLNLSFNDLLSTDIPKSIDFPQVESLHSLILVGTKAKWSVVWHLLEHARNVQDLHLSLNGYETIDLDKYIFDEKDVRNADLADQSDGNKLNIANAYDKQGFENIKMIMFDQNPVTSWEEIAKLGWMFPNLQFLSLTSCPIQNLPSNAHQSFQALKTLWMSNSLIADLNTVEKFEYFPLLTDLRLSGMPYLKDFSEEKRRQHIISILPNILTLNRGRVISPGERETAERNFIRHYRHESNPPARFHELSEKHGKVPDLVDINLKPPKTTTLIIRNLDKELARKAINLKLSVKELKEFLEPIVGMHPSKMKLYYYDVDGEWKDEMKFPNKKLFSYNMQENDQIVIDEK